MSANGPQVVSGRANGVSAVSDTQTQASDAKSKGGSSEASNRKGGKGRSRQDKDKASDALKKSPKSKKEPEGEKLTVRRLPPGLTQAEFMNILGPEWEVGKGKVDWLLFAPGKLSVDPSKPSRPGRAYVHVAQKDIVMSLSETVRSSVWEDAKNTFNNPCLLSPPYVEFSIYKKFPSGKKRADARQGTIDQDAEFMAFLEELANPTPSKEVGVAEDEEAAKGEAKITTTPLVQYILEKKAQKAKEAAAPKSSKHSRNDSTGKGKGSKEEESSTARRRGKDSKADKTDKQPKEPVKILSKRAASDQAAEPSKPTPAPVPASTDAPKSRRAGIAAAARILQRDLGLSPGSAHRKARQDAAKVEPGPKNANGNGNESGAPAQVKNSTDKRATSPVPPGADPPAQGAKVQLEMSNASRSQSGRRNRGGKSSEKSKMADSPATPTPASATAKPVILKKKSENLLQGELPPSSTAPNQASATASSSSNTPGPPTANASKSHTGPKKAPAITAGATRGFVKHANPSQGITEPALKQALETFGTITFVEIDKRKGFAYVDFATHDSLVAAISASPITVAHGTVQVLERKDKKANPPVATPSVRGSSGPEKATGTNGTGSRGRRGRGGGGASNKAAGGQGTSQTAASQTAPPVVDSG